MGESLSKSGKQPDLYVMAREIVADLEAAPEQFWDIANDLSGAKRRARIGGISITL